MTVEQLESIIFVSGSTGVSIETFSLAHTLPATEIERLISELEHICAHNRVYILVHTGSVYYFTSKPQYSDVIAATRTVIADEPLTRAQSETLAIVQYLGSVTKSNIDSLRGVNSVQPLRVLESRYLIVRNGEHSGSTVYVPTVDSLHHMGISSHTQLPDFEQIHAQLVAYIEKVK